MINLKLFGNSMYNNNNNVGKKQLFSEIFNMQQSLNLMNFHT